MHQQFLKVVANRRGHKLAVASYLHNEDAFVLFCELCGKVVERKPKDLQFRCFGVYSRTRHSTQSFARIRSGRHPDQRKFGQLVMLGPVLALPPNEG